MKPFFKKCLSAEQIKDVLEYDPTTGLFSWIKPRRYRAKPGDIAGTINKRGYVRITINFEDYAAHRLAWVYMTGSEPIGVIDHINHIRSDNRFSNLRLVTHVDNARNRVPPKNTSGVYGVNYRQKARKWVAVIGLKYLGSFDHVEDAIRARKKAEEFFGFHQNHGLNI